MSTQSPAGSSLHSDGRYALSEKTSETDDQRIRDVTPLPPPDRGSSRDR